MAKRRTLRKIRGGGGTCGKGKICHINAEAAAELGQEVLEALLDYTNSVEPDNLIYLAKARKAIAEGADLTIMNKDGFRAIDLALRSGDYELIELIPDMLKNPTVNKFINLKNGMGRTPLETAIDIAPSNRSERIPTMIYGIIEKGGLITPAIIEQARITLAEDRRNIPTYLANRYAERPLSPPPLSGIGGRRKRYTRKYSKKSRKYRK